MPERGSGAAGAVSRLSEWVDEHLGLLRSLSAGMAVAGLLVLARSVRMLVLELRRSFLQPFVQITRVYLCGCTAQAAWSK